MTRIRVDFEMLVRRPVCLSDSERQHGSAVVPADLCRDAVPPRAQIRRRREPVRVEVSVFFIAQDFAPVQKHAHRSGGASPEGDRARVAPLNARVAYESSHVHAHLFFRTNECAEIDPCVRGGWRQETPAHRAVLLAVVVAREIDRDVQLLLRVMRCGEA